MAFTKRTPQDDKLVAIHRFVRLHISTAMFNIKLRHGQFFIYVDPRQSVPDKVTEYARLHDCLITTVI